MYIFTTGCCVWMWLLGGTRRQWQSSYCDSVQWYVCIYMLSGHLKSTSTFLLFVLVLKLDFIQYLYNHLLYKRVPVSAYECLLTNLRMWWTTHEYNFVKKMCWEFEKAWTAISSNSGYSCSWFSRYLLKLVLFFYGSVIDSTALD